MGSVVSWVVRLRVKPGQLDSFKALMEEMVASTKTEPDTLAYEWFIDAAGENVHIYERYASSEATMTHAAGFGEKFAERFLACVDITSFDIYGEPSDDVKNVFTELGPSFLGTWGGFAR
jgi:quinol monooxygenase YgiN